MAEKAIQVSKKTAEKAFFDGALDVGEFGKENSLRYRVLVLVIEERYDEAVDAFKKFQESPSDFPNFRFRVTRFVEHGIDLVFAIKAKKNFPGMRSLTRAKQQELRDKVRSHLRELVQVLKVIENVQIDLRIRDAGSTKYVIKAIWAAFLCIAALGFALEFTDWIGRSSYKVIDNSFHAFAEWIVARLGL